MPIFVHLAPEAGLPRILANGIRRSPARSPLPSGVYAMPLTRNHYASHQWLRELKSSGVRTIVGVYFRLPDEEPVWFGHFGYAHVLLEASEAAHHVSSAPDPVGLEVLVPRRILPGEIVRSRRLRQVIGWRYYPTAHGRPPCGCPSCLPAGQIKSRALRKAYRSGPDGSHGD
jgi:hypothetical protein